MTTPDGPVASQPGVARRWPRRDLLVGLGGLGALALSGCSSTGGGKTGFHQPRHPLPTAESGSFFSKARQRRVNWTISYPPGLTHHTGLPLVLALHPFMGSHAFPMGGITPARLLTMRPGGHAIPAVAVAAVDGGNDYWHRHPGDDPMAMLLKEFLPLCRARGLGRDQKIAVIGTSMGGYGALLIAEENPDLVAAVAVVSPAIWLTFQDSRLDNATAFTSEADFETHDVVSHAATLASRPVWVRSGSEDPFHSGVEALAAALPSAHVGYPPGGHDDAFFKAHAPRALQFAATHLVAKL